jgi:hypothetical protein
MQHQNRILNGQ